MNCEKLRHWTQKKSIPQRLLLVGNSALQEAISLAAILQNTEEKNISSGIEADVLLVSDQGESFKVGENDIDETLGPTARFLPYWFSKTPVSPYRIVILENFDQATNAALNALLKIIEEPPQKGIFIATTKNPYRLPSTILSRMNLVFLSLESEGKDETAEKFLTQKNILDAFSFLSGLGKDFKKQAEKEGNSAQNLWKHFTKNLLISVRKNPAFFPFIADFWEAYEAVERNQNPLFCLERLAKKVFV